MFIVRFTAHPPDGEVTETHAAVSYRVRHHLDGRKTLTLARPDGRAEVIELSPRGDGAQYREALVMGPDGAPIERYYAIAVATGYVAPPGAIAAA